MLGQEIESALWPDDQEPADPQAFEDGLRRPIEPLDLDSDGDGATNRGVGHRTTLG